jgi:ABC-type nitrate/sulfonate/bicarbonate transport system substrate-binding protein
MGSFSRIFLVVLFALAALSGQQDQSVAQERVRIAWAGVSPANSPIWVVQEKGLLKKHGLNGEVISISASPIALQALLAGEVDVIVTSVTTLALSRLAGADIVMILGMVPTFLDHIISHPSVTTLDQIKGKTGGVNRLGSTSDLGLRLALRRKASIRKRTSKLLPPETIPRGWRRFLAESFSSVLCRSLLSVKLRSSVSKICSTFNH